jgi:putative Holliday junction resolvase
MKLLGIDYGESKIGLAVGEVEAGLATPFGLVKNDNWNQVFDDIKIICQKERIDKIVVGIPVNPLDPHSEQIEKVNKFISQLAEFTGVPVDSIDERFSTQEAQKLIEKKKSKDDELSAMLILQNYIDKN